MKRYSIFLSILIFCFCFCADAIAVTLKREFTADKYPEGGHPVDKTHFNKFSFSLKDLNLDTSKYYDIDARLTSTNYKGYAANFGTTTSSDLKFHRDDNTGWNFEGADHLHYEWTTDPKQQSVPGTITVRCYDWGAAGSVTVTVKETDGVGNPIGMGVSDTQLIPYDDNENGIADGWETVASVKVLLENNLLGYDPDWDGEVAPDATNNNNGDGWTNRDEWRGIFTSRTDEEVTRLDVEQKDVMVCSDAAMASLGTGNTPKIEKHLIRKLEPYQEDGTWSLVNNPWSNVFKNYKIDFDNTNEDLGWVNFNSSQYSEKRVWAIRIVEESEEDEKKAETTGYTSGGSPSQYTQAVILTGNIKAKVNRHYAKAVTDNKKNRKAQHDKKAEEYEKKATEEEANGNATQANRLRTKAANERKKGENFKWTAGTQKRIDSAIELMTKDTIAHEVLHDHNVNAHCGHRGCFMNAVTVYQVKFDGGYKAQAGGRDVNKLILDSRHNNTLAVTGHTRAKVAFYGENIEVTVEAPAAP